MGVIEGFGVFVVGTVCYGAGLWAGMKTTGVRGTFMSMLLIAPISAAGGFVPTLGGVLSALSSSPRRPMQISGRTPFFRSSWLGSWDGRGPRRA